ncbi:MAG: 16S rRNA (uracil(1498)-N(3))-methyltransferase [Bacilli bacterium]|nr:16S rRNA (uracil(1498)-N(3))-methyltransferase [Bacilli bacterium]
MQRYFVKEKNNNQFTLSNNDVHHIKKVMRYKENDKIEIVYEEKVYLCNIDDIDSLKLSIVDSYEEDRELDINLTIAIALVQEQKFDLILQKLTELGVTSIIPLKTERSIVKIDKTKEDKKMLRWETICKEASEQSHRVTIPKIHNIKTMKELIDDKKELNLICSLNDNTKPLESYLNNEIKDILFVIGPEGGFTKNEEDFLIQNGFSSTTLGKRVLRVETAAIYVASIINYIYKG